MAGLSDLSFDPGIEFSALVSSRFGCSVSSPHALSTSAFHLVASFGRSALRLDVDSVSLILQSCLGGLQRISMFSTFQVGCSNFQSPAKMSDSWFIGSKVSFAKPFWFSSICGVMEILTGAETLISWRKMLNGP
jgi:hypothetical protein